MLKKYIIKQDTKGDMFSSLPAGFILPIPEKYLFKFTCNKDYTECRRIANYKVASVDGFYFATGAEYARMLFVKLMKEEKPHKYWNMNADMDDMLSEEKDGIKLIFDKPEEVKRMIKEGVNFKTSKQKRAEIMNYFKHLEIEWKNRPYDKNEGSGSFSTSVKF